MGRSSWRNRCVRLLLVLVTSVMMPAAAWAQLDQGRLTGTVTDAQGAVLPGVTVTATSPSLIGTQTAVSEENGTYRFPALASGTYALTFELTGFRTVKRENIQLSIGQTLTVDLALEVSTVEETVLVTSESPVVDLQSTKVGVEFSAEKLAAIPSATDLWAALGQAPGVRMLGFDVGGSHKSQQVGYESFGVRNQNRVVTEGVDTTEGTNAAGIYQDFFAHEEVSVSASGADVSMSTPGSAVVSSIKSGGNQFSSLNNVTYEGSRFVDNNIDDDTRARGFTGQPNLKFWEAHFDLGGPIKRDKAWFYAAYNAFTIDKVISGVSRQFTDLAEFENYTVKGTYRASQKDTLVGYYQWGAKNKPRRGLSSTVGPDSILAQNAPSEMWNAQHQRVWNNRLFTDAKVGWWGFAWPMVPAVDWRQAPPRFDSITSVETGAGWLAGNQGGPFTFQRDKPQFTVTATYYLPDKMGDHDFKAGIEYANDQSRNRQQRQFGADPVSRSQRPDRRDPRRRLQHVRDLRHRLDRPGRSQHALVGVLPGSLAAGEPRDDHGGHPLRPSAAALRSVDPHAAFSPKSSPSRPCPRRASSRAARSCRDSASPTTSARRASRSRRCSTAATTTTSPIASRARILAAPTGVITSSTT